MKKIVLSLFALLALGEGANAQKITVPDVYAAPGQTVAFVVNLDEGKDDTYKALQFDVQFPTTGFTTTGAYTVSDSWEGASAIVGDVDSEGSATVPFNCSNLIQGTKVNYLASVSFKVGESVEAGDYNVTLKNIFLGYNMADKDFPADCTFKVHVLSGVNVVLDENSPIAPETTASAVDIKVFRTINANEWSTICLPFAMSADKWKAAFGDDAEIRPFNGYEKEGDGLKVKLGEKLTTKAMTVANAYFIKTSALVEDFTVNAKITGTAGPKVSISEEDEETGEEVEFAYLQGTYVAGTKVPAQNLFLNSNKFYYSTGKTMTKGFRAYMWLKDVLDSYSSAPEMITFVIDDNNSGNTTSISSLKSGESDDAYYNLSGQRVENLKKGQIYIKNNKKVVVK